MPSPNRSPRFALSVLAPVALALAAGSALAPPAAIAAGALERLTSQELDFSPCLRAWYRATGRRVEIRDAAEPRDAAWLGSAAEVPRTLFGGEALPEGAGPLTLHPRHHSGVRLSRFVRMCRAPSLAALARFGVGAWESSLMAEIAGSGSALIEALEAPSAPGSASGIEVVARLAARGVRHYRRLPTEDGGAILEIQHLDQSRSRLELGPGFFRTEIANGDGTTLRVAADLSEPARL